MKKKFLIFILLVLTSFSTFAGDFKYRAYESDRYIVQVTPLKDEPCGNLGIRNLIRVIVYDKVEDIYWAMHYIVDADWEYTYNEYKTNPDLRAHKTPNLGITNHDINQFASRIAREVYDMKTSNPSAYTEEGKWRLAYSYTEYDAKNLARSYGK